MERLTIIGTGHVFDISKAIHDAIKAIRPDVVFVELDRGRLEGLLAKRRGVLPERGSFVQKRLARFQEGIAGMYGSEVGGEMLAAVEAAQAIGAEVRLIDRPAEATLRQAMREMTWRERLRGLGQLAKAGVMGLLPGDRKQQIEDEIKQYQDDPTAALQELKGQYPTIYRVLIHDRNVLMAKRIVTALQPASEDAPPRRGLAVVGDGHVDGMLAELAELGPVVYRLDDVRQGRLPIPAASDASVSFTIDW